ncbi:dihydroxyacetone kinase family protein [Agilicoccus flavus]|uniref:dihydroxyacetone kinase family protein n=1 Tax=Agilicoccus flavus TaxID=2775968 RepID=UPI001CF6136D|nr:dihydroxyacetone kinase family protein [Agilicoccus flavus]
MTHLYDDPTTFMEDALAGFLDLYPQYVTGVPGGVVRAQEPSEGKVAVVVGGGSGHYPAFCGVVGPGFADGAVVGNIFTSPSTLDAYHVGKAAASGGGGLLFSTGNYAGDVMNFDLAKERLEAEGIPTRNVYVTDDVASAPVEDAHKRRGIAGDFVVFKVAGAAADDGCDLDEVERLARKANDRTRTMGVGLDGCTMPGEDDKLFHVPAGKMGVGLGIHGEPGIAEEDLPRASELAELLVDRVLAEEPEGSTKRVGAILNGLGATKYEELFVVWTTVARLLRERGFTIVEPECGELVTSLDMAGISLTLVFLDDELEGYWTAPADTPAYRKGSVAGAKQSGPRRAELTEDDLKAEVSPGSEASKAAAAQVVTALEAMEKAIADAESDLAKMDSVAGDGDHGRGMVKGVTNALAAAKDAAQEGAGVAGLLGAAGDAWAGKAGGTSGVLWGAALRSGGESIGDVTGEVTPEMVAAAVRAAADRMSSLGKAEPGDKTMLDALLPFVDTLESEVSGGTSLADAWGKAAQVAVTKAQETADLTPKVGRARPLAERSVGTPDPGATSLAMCARVVGEALGG